MKEIIKELERVGYFIQGSFVLDRIFNKNCARDIDVFLIGKNKEEIPEIEKGKPYDIVDLGALDRSILTDEELLVGIYNTDRYFLIEGKITFPKNYPSVPKELQLLPELEKEEIGLEDVIVGVKISSRYGLKPTKKVEKKWKETMIRVFSGREEVERYIREILEKKTAENERKKIFQELKNYYPRL